MKNKRNKPITLEGKTFESKIEACKYYNVKYTTVNSRLRRGWSLEEAFEIKEHINPFKKYNEIILNGEKMTISEACKKYNVYKQSVYSKLSIGWSFEEIFGLKYRNNNSTMVEIKGKTFKSIKEACDYYKVNYNTIIQRLYKGMNIKEAIFTPIVLTNNGGGKRKPITVKNKRFASVKEATDYYNDIYGYNLNYGTVKYQLRKGKSPEEVFILKERKYKK